MKKEFTFLNDYGKKSIFYRKDYYDEVCALITDFFQETLVMNDFHKRFINTLNELENYDDVFNIVSEMPYYWAICIIQNDFTIDSLIKGKNQDDYIKWAKEFIKKKNRVSYIFEPVNEEKYFIENDIYEGKIFYTEKYYNFVKGLVINFFKKEFKENEFHHKFLGFLNTIHLSNSFNEVLSKEPYQWALSIIKNKDVKDVMKDEDLKKYAVIEQQFFKFNNIKAFIE